MTDSHDTGRADPNAADQTAMWNGAMGERWLANHRALDRLLRPYGEASVAALGDVAGASVVDIGCGTGSTTAAIASVVGADGSAIGADISAQLVQTATADHGASGASFVVADAGADDLGGPHDAMHSRFGVMFFPDPPAAYAHLRTQLRPGGRLSAVVWQAPTENQWVITPLALVSEHIELPEPGPPGGPGPFSMADPDGIRSLLASTGWSDIGIDEVRVPMTVGDDAQGTAEFLLAMLPTGPVLDELGPERTSELAAHVAAGLPVVDGQATLEGAAWSVTATA